jgi:hypothetical protein
MNRRTLLRNLAMFPLGLQFLPRKESSPLFPDLFETAPVPVVSASMWSYLWDFADEGYDEVLTRIKNNGMNAVSLACAYHNGKFLTPHDPKRKVVFLEDGTIYFKPNPALYKTVKPIVNSLVKQGHGLAELKRHADRVGLETNAWVVCCHNSALGSRYPEIACETVFGDKLIHSLCPSNNNVRAYLKALVRDIASHRVGRIELEALQFQGYTHGYHHEREGIALNPAMKFLLGLCFCPACVARAKQSNLDLTPVREFVQETLVQHFVHPAKEQFKTQEELPSEILGPFLEWRKTVLVSLAGELVDAVQSTHVALRPLISFDAAARTVVGADPGPMAHATGGVLVPGYVTDPASLRDVLRTLQTSVGANEMIVGFQVGLPESGGRQQFLERMRIAREMGIVKFNFYNYGLIPFERFAWINDALS